MEIGVQSCFFSDSRAMVLNLDHILDSEKNYFIYLFWAVLDLCCRVGFFLIVVSGGYSLVWASHCGGFSCCTAWALGQADFSNCGTWAQ